MIIISEVRCSDCLAEFNNGPRFAVVKEDKSQSYSDEEKLHSAHLHQVLVCADCAQWYDDACEVGNG